MNLMTRRMIKNIEYLHKKYGDRLNTKQKWIIAYWYKIDRLRVESGRASVNDILNKATNPADILNCLEFYRSMR